MGSINQEKDTMVVIRLVKNGINKEECFDKIADFGFGEFYEKNQTVLRINLTKKAVIKE